VPDWSRFQDLPHRFKVTGAETCRRHVFPTTPYLIENKGPQTLSWRVVVDDILQNLNFAKRCPNVVA